MRALKEAAQDFLKLRTIAVAGVSRNGNAVGNLIYKKLKEAGYEVFALNPNINEIQGDPCYPDVTAVPSKIEGMLIATHPEQSKQIVMDCIAQGVEYIWFHQSIDNGSFSKEASDYALEHGLNVITGGCPMMFCHPVDFGHKCMRWIFSVTGKIPKRVPA